jgi:hypothetical protein
LQPWRRRLDTKEQTDTKKKATTKRKAAEKPSKTRGAKKRNPSATGRLGTGEKQGKRIKALKADKEGFQERISSLERESAVQVALNSVQIESVKHETEARMAKAGLEHQRASSKLAVEQAFDVMPVSLARQLLNTHAIALGGLSTGALFPTSLTQGYGDIRQFTVP